LVRAPAVRRSSRTCGFGSTAVVAPIVTFGPTVRCPPALRSGLSSCCAIGVSPGGSREGPIHTFCSRVDIRGIGASGRVAVRPRLAGFVGAFAPGDRCPPHSGAPVVLVADVRDRLPNHRTGRQRGLWQPRRTPGSSFAAAVADWSRSGGTGPDRTGGGRSGTRRSHSARRYSFRAVVACPLTSRSS
jgi:hypothetical protein